MSFKKRGFIRKNFEEDIDPLRKWATSTQDEQGNLNIELVNQVQEIVKDEPEREEMVLYRGERRRAAKAMLKRIKNAKGNVLELERPVSTSGSVRKAYEFLGSPGVFWEVRSKVYRGVGKSERIMREDEYIIPAGKYKIQKVSEPTTLKGHHKDGTSFMAMNVTKVWLELLEPMKEAIFDQTTKISHGVELDQGEE